LTDKPGSGSDSSMNEVPTGLPAPRIVVEPRVATIDIARNITLHGFARGEPVTVTATLRHNDSSMWRGEAVFVADPEGHADLRMMAPSSGTYDGVSSMGLVWSMRQTGESVPLGTPFDQTAVQTVRLTATAASGAADASFEQCFIAPGVQVRPIHEDGVVATLFTPPQPGPHPLVIVLSGSGGGLMEARAALFSAHGYAALALGYFGAPGLPPTLSQIPLEYFERALKWVRRTLEPGFVALVGVSRGGELALLLGATMPGQIDAVAAYVPSSVTNGVLNAGRPGEHRHAAAWSWRGRNLPVLAQDNPRADWDLFDRAPPPKRQTPAFLAALGDAQATSRASIAVEQIRGPIMLISGRDDALWPSARFGELIAQRLAAAGYPYPVCHLCYDDAGHTIGYPYCPTTVLARAHPVSRLELAYGGTAAGNARASTESWPALLAFLDTARQRPSGN
jgi:dienelactone hydrolase